MHDKAIGELGETGVQMQTRDFIIYIQKEELFFVMVLS